MKILGSYIGDCGGPYDLQTLICELKNSKNQMETLLKYFEGDGTDAELQRRTQ